MRILHVTFGLAPTETGGLPAYVRDLAIKEMKLKNEVFILQPGSYRINPKVKIVRKKEKLNVYHIINPLPIPSIFGIGNPNMYVKKCEKDIYKSFFNKIKPDIIHIHSIMGVHKECFEVAKELGIKMVYTTHDYFGLCIRTNFIDRENKICSKNDCQKCADCNYQAGLSKKKIVIMQSNIYKKIKKWKILKKIRSRLRRSELQVNKVENIKTTSNEVEVTRYKILLNYYKTILLLIDYFHFNSNVAKKVFESNLGKLKGSVIPITLSTIKDNREKKETNYKKKDKLIVGYIGRNEPYKGINLLMESLKELKKEVKYECRLYGDDFKNYENINPNVINKGMYQRDKIEEIMKDIDILIVPSIWKETFGFVILEALSYNVPVITTDNVGSKMLLERCELKPIIETNKIALSKKIEEFAMNRHKLEEYQEWIQGIANIFSMDIHANNILEMYREMIK